MSTFRVGLLLIGDCTPKEITNDSGGNGIVPGLKMTARQGYALALPEAKKFSSDSYLADLNTSGVERDGKSNTWYVYFYSPSKNTNYKVNVVGGKVDKTEEGDKKKKDRIADGWVDSTDVAKVAAPRCKEAGEIAEPNTLLTSTRVMVPVALFGILTVWWAKVKLLKCM